MSSQSIRVTIATTAEISPIVDLIRAQESRQLAQGFRLHEVRSRARLEMDIASALTSAVPPLVALDEQDRVRGYAEPTVWTLRQNSILLSFLTARNGIVQDLTLPDPLHWDAATVLRALLAALDTFWHSADTTGDLIRWPTGDSWLEPFLYEQHFQLDSICALRSLQPFFPSRPIPPPSLHIRPALPNDEEVLVQLFEGELLFHKPYVPFVHSNPQVLQAFRHKSAQLWMGLRPDAGAPLVLVVERDREVVAMAEMTLLSVEPTDEPGFTPPGHYCCIDNMSVREDLQGQGIGRLLAQAIEDALPAFQSQLDGYILWFNPANPKASSFWSRLSFQPLWTTYQRLHASSNGARFPV
jgi:GNAT superfamily N-acetyltransferase